MVILLGLTERRREDTASAVHPRCHGSHWDAERMSHFLVGEVSKCDEQENVAVVCGEVGQGSCKAGSCPARVGTFGEGGLVEHRPLVDSRTRQGTQPSLFGSAMATQQVRGDPE
jgi:hypothetical protein